MAQKISEKIAEFRIDGSKIYYTDATWLNGEHTL